MFSICLKQTDTNSVCSFLRRLHPQSLPERFQDVQLDPIKTQHGSKMHPKWWQQNSNIPQHIPTDPITKYQEPKLIPKRWQQDANTPKRIETDLATDDTRHQQRTIDSNRRWQTTRDNNRRQETTPDDDSRQQSTPNDNRRQQSITDDNRHDYFCRRPGVLCSLSNQVWLQNIHMIKTHIAFPRILCSTIMNHLSTFQKHRMRLWVNHGWRQTRKSNSFVIWLCISIIMFTLKHRSKPKTQTLKPLRKRGCITTPAQWTDKVITSKAVF